MGKGIVNPDNVVFLAGTGDGIIPVGDDRKTVFVSSVYGVDLSINMIIIVPIQEVGGRPPILVVIQTLIVKFAHRVFGLVAISAEFVEVIDHPAVSFRGTLRVQDVESILAVLFLGIVRAIGKSRPDILHVGPQDAPLSLPDGLQEVTHSTKAHLVVIFLHQTLGLEVATNAVGVRNTVVFHPLGGVAHLRPGIKICCFLVVAPRSTHVKLIPVIPNIDRAVTIGGHRAGGDVICRVHNFDLPHPVALGKPGKVHIGPLQHGLRGGIHLAVAAGQGPAELVNGAHGGPVEEIAAPLGAALVVIVDGGTGRHKAVT